MSKSWRLRPSSQNTSVCSVLSRGILGEGNDKDLLQMDVRLMRTIVHLSVKDRKTQSREARKNTILQAVEQKPHSQKDRQDEKAEGYVPDEGTRQNCRKTTK